MLYAQLFTIHSDGNITIRFFNWSLPMRLLLSGIIAAASLALAIAAFAQSPTSTPAVPTNPSAAAPVASGKRFACKTASQGMKGQEQKDQMQLCMAQAHLDCLKQAIDQKVVGPQRRDFVKSCAE
jgi:hypothetical protein